jgi:hypothetical protein
MKILLLVLSIFFAQQIFAQPSDFILLKKNKKTIATYFLGTNIGFYTNTGAFIQANITQIKNDTLYLKQYIVRQIPTQLGIYVLDTVNSYLYQYHYNQIKSIGKTGRRFDLNGSGAVLMGGGVLLLVGSAIVFLADNKNFSPELMGAAAGLAGLGYLLSRVNNKGYIIGKKYSLVYVQAIAAKKM